jgi:hypothetical protein
VSSDTEKFARRFQALVDQVLAGLPRKRKNVRPRVHVMSAYMATHEKYRELYKKLAE